MQWQSEHPLQVNKLKDLQNGLRSCRHLFMKSGTQRKYPWNALWQWGELELDGSTGGLAGFVIGAAW